MSIGALDAVTAYGRILDGGGTAPAASSTTGIAPGGSFGSMINQLVTSTASSLHAAEGASARQIAGKDDLVDVATAIGAAETALDTVVAVRDRMVNAYSEIMRMQI